MHSTEVSKARLGYRVLTEDGFSSEFSSAVKSKALRLFIANEGPPGGRLLGSPSKDPKVSKDHRIGFNSIFNSIYQQFRVKLSFHYRNITPSMRQISTSLKGGY